MPPTAWVYILRLHSGGLYIGATRDLDRRLREHADAHGNGRATSEDRAHQLVYTEQHLSITSALLRERQLKRWTRAKKEALISGDLARLRRLSRRRR